MCFVGTLRAACAAALVLALAACSPSSHPTAAAGTGASPTNSSGFAPTVSASLTPGPTSNPLAPTSVSTTEFPVARPLQGPPYRYDGRDDNPDLTVNAAGTSGSGCAPGAGNGLPDGVWGGYVTEWGSSVLRFDLACFYGGDTPRVQSEFDACIAAVDPNQEAGADGCYMHREDGDVVNDSSQTRDLAVAADAEFVDMWDPDVVSGTDRSWSGKGLRMTIAQASTLDSWSAGGKDSRMWVFVNGGLVTQVLSVYAP